ncbi:phosphoglucosamine mutase [Fluviicola sp.]|jgi:phosphomannomutase|uniref:phosphoglucosamine mutase n=1 Tax=Fluviicola sp. TaxID=1917219 RepID=UPI0028172C08|nr:phosphoglucosamine mutase [Fluviicola sp.]MDR0802905.1 phosphoglucosamine mutase [Fluviicola sp.]
MTLIKSISGIRGMIGGAPGDNLTPIDAVQFAAAYGTWLKSIYGSGKLKVVVGRDARLSGEMIAALVIQTLVGLGIKVIDLGLSTTPTVEMAVPYHQANGGIILTASHNPKQWNALKLLNSKGEFISGEEGELLLKIAGEGSFVFAEIDEIGKVVKDEQAIERHIDAVCALPDVDIPAISNANFKVVVDAVNSTGGISVPQLLRKLGVRDIIEIYCEPTGYFPHNPEPLKEHLTELSARVISEKAHLGITVDPDVDRLALVNEDGSMFGEEYTLVAVSEYILSKRKGATVSNLSSTRALRDITEEAGCAYHASAVGEVNVVVKMKETNAVIGGEGNGGIIYPDLHYGRDSLVGIALFLSHLAYKKMSMTALRASYPNYEMAKKKIDLTPGIDVDAILKKMAEKYQNEEVDTADGVKIYIGKEWVHLRKSNTEPIIRVYTESKDAQAASGLADRIIGEIQSLIRSNEKTA